ncbi:MAG TPA: hypothetical protein VJP05_10325 [Acidimicrobiia bacterium]|nr:hypothetical protein [Acidimicrobiia bacterium]
MTSLRRIARRIPGAVRWRAKAARRAIAWRFRSRRLRGRIPHLVVHASFPPGLVTAIGDALVARSRALADDGVVVVGGGQIRDAGRAGWSAVADTVDRRKFSRAIRQVSRRQRVKPPLRALVLSTGRALGSERPTVEETRLLRPRAVGVMEELVNAVPARRVTVVLDLPSSDDLLGMILAAAVERGRDPGDLATPLPGLTAELAGRIESIDRVDEVVVLEGGEATPANLVTCLGSQGLAIALKPSRGATPRWNLRSVGAARDVSPHLDRAERRLVQSHLRRTMAEPPSRPPQTLLADAIRPLIDLAGTDRIRTLHLHIGIQKTATTTIQGALHSGQTALRDQGVVYLDRRYMMRLSDLRAWRAYPHSGRTEFSAFARQLKGAVDEARRTAIAAGAPGDVVLISNETMVGAMEKGPFLERPFRPRAEAAIEDVLDILQPQDCRLILVVRRQDTLIESQYMWQIHGGQWFPFDRVAGLVFDHPEALSFTDLADRLERIPGVSALTVSPFEQIRFGVEGFLHQILQSVGATLDVSSLSFDAESNPSYSERALEIALAVNSHLDTREQRWAVRDFLRAAFPVEASGRASLLDDDSRRRIIDLFAEDNRRLFETRMPHLPPDAYATTATTEVLAAPQRSNSPGTG